MLLQQKEMTREREVENKATDQGSSSGLAWTHWYKTLIGVTIKNTTIKKRENV